MRNRSYLVTWRIDVDADGADDAARQARAAMRRKGTTANVFEVTDHGTGKTETVDLFYDKEGTK